MWRGQLQMEEGCVEEGCESQTGKNPAHWHILGVLQQAWANSLRHEDVPGDGVTTWLVPEPTLRCTVVSRRFPHIPCHG